jgi:hypothetical protein
MGARLGRHSSSSSNPQEKQEVEESINTKMSTSSNNVADRDVEEIHNNSGGDNLEDDGLSSTSKQQSNTPEASSTSCSWRTRSENWSKKRRPKKDSSFFVSKRGKSKWAMSKKSSKGEAELPLGINAGAEAGPSSTGSTSCVCTLYRRTNSEEPSTRNVVGTLGTTNETASSSSSSSGCAAATAFSSLGAGTSSVSANGIPTVSVIPRLFSNASKFFHI